MNHADSSLKRNAALLHYVAPALCLLLASLAATADTITIAGDYWCPYSCQPDSQSPGYMVEVAQEALNPYGHTVKYVLMPWARAVRMAEAAEINGVIGTAPYLTPTFLMPSNEQGIGRFGVYVRADDPWRFTTPESLKGRRIGLIIGYGYLNIGDYLRKNPTVVHIEQTGGQAALETNIKKLLVRRIDTTVENEWVMTWKLAETKREGQLLNVGRSEAGLYYIGFGPTNPNNAVYARQLSDGMVKLRQSGRLAAIMKKYHLTDWE